MQNSVRRVLLLSVLASSVSAAQAQSTIEELRALWDAQNYQEAYDGLTQYRKQPYGKTFEVYYMAGTSLCRLDGKAEVGRKYLQWILDNYRLGDPARRIVVEEQRTKCPPAIQEGPIEVAWNTTAATAGVSGSTKMFYFVDQENAIRSVPVEVVRDIPREVLTGRLFAPSAVDDALASAATVVGSEGETVAGEHFVLASMVVHSPSQLGLMAKKLDQVYSFFISQYGMRAPDSLITAYLVPDLNTLQQLAESLHGIKVAPQSLGYSYRDDMSMVGYVPGPGIGTLLHELFHLMVRNDFGDIPPWLDEGLAALYEVSAVTEDSVRGTPNWRGEVLEQLSDLQPSVEELVEMNWLEFSSAEGEYDTEMQAANHAKARYLMLFFQETGQLTAVYRRFQAREIGEDSAALLREVLDANDLDEVELCFQEWFGTVNQRGGTSGPDCALQQLRVPSG